MLAGPVCPVERDPPDPECAPRPVSGAGITVTNTESGNGATAVSDDDGLYRLVVDAGPLRVVAGPVEGYLGIPDRVLVTGIAERTLVVDLLYDTGVR